MAEAFARLHGGESVEPFSAGSKPSGRVNPRAIEFMKEKGYDLSTHSSKSLSDIPAGEYAAAITMGCGDACPLVNAKLREDWVIPDPKELPPNPFREVRDLIEQKVRELLVRIQANGGEAWQFFGKESLPLRTDSSGARFWAVAFRKAMLTYFEVPAHKRFDWHQHDSEQITLVLNGELFFEVANQVVCVGAGEVIAISSNVPHAVFTSAHAAKAVDAWSPIREDLLEKPMH
jgi:protein-tyrosine-phosphatase